MSAPIAYSRRQSTCHIHHDDLIASKRDAAILAGAIQEAVEDGLARRRRAEGRVVSRLGWLTTRS
jgi:hypothetical protein